MQAICFRCFTQGCRFKMVDCRNLYNFFSNILFDSLHILQIINTKDDMWLRLTYLCIISLGIQKDRQKLCTKRRGTIYQYFLFCFAKDQNWVGKICRMFRLKWLKSSKLFSLFLDVSIKYFWFDYWAYTFFKFKVIAINTYSNEHYFWKSRHSAHKNILRLSSMKFSGIVFRISLCETKRKKIRLVSCIFTKTICMF